MFGNSLFRFICFHKRFNISFDVCFIFSSNYQHDVWNNYECDFMCSTTDVVCKLFKSDSRISAIISNSASTVAWAIVSCLKSANARLLLWEPPRPANRWWLQRTTQDYTRLHARGRSHQNDSDHMHIFHLPTHSATSINNMVTCITVCSAVAFTSTSTLSPRARTVQRALFSSFSLHGQCNFDIHPFQGIKLPHT